MNEDAIAVVGMALRAPMAADHHEFWANVVSGRECLSTVDESRPGWVPVKGTLEHADEFDAGFFGFSRREAEITDPQQRVFLELVWHALEDAGHTPQSCGRVGVFASMTQSRYDRLVSPDSVGDLQLRIACESDFLATRTAYRLGLRGPAMTVQTACSSSLVAVHVAVTSLLAGDCDTAVAGGVTITLPLREGYRYQTGSILSPDGHCRAFDSRAAGTVPGNGGAAVVLRRLEDALADRDDIYAVILGSAINNDGGHKVGFTAPSAAGQRAVITAALLAAQVSPDEVGFIEAHGTGTALGDPVEVQALREVFGTARADGSWCGLASTKSNIGHLDAAAGVTGFVKAVQAVHHGVVPPTAGFETPNPELRLAESPFRVLGIAEPWSIPGRRVAGVSAFGVGGTNVHVVLAQAPPRMDVHGAEPVSFTLSARTPAALEKLAANLADHLSRHPDLLPVDVAYTMSARRVEMPHERVVSGSTLAELIAALRSTQDSSPVANAPDGRRVHLPGYPFERERFWPSPDRAVDGGQALLAGLFAEVVGREPDTDRQSFFDLGGDSLMAIQLISRVSAVTGVEPDLEQFFHNPTVAGLAEQIDQAAIQ